MSRHLPVLLTTVALIVAPSSTAAQADPHLAVEAWTADLSTVDGDDVNVAFAHDGLRLADLAAAPASVRGTGPIGMLVLPSRTLAVPANRVYAEPAAMTPAGAAVDVGVRGWVMACGPSGSRPARLAPGPRPRVPCSPRPSPRSRRGSPCRRPDGRPQP